MKCKNYFIIFLSFLVISFVNAQTILDSSFKSAPIQFGKLIGVLTVRKYRPELYAKAYASYSRSAFMDMREGKNRRIFECGFRYKRFEEYCIKNQIAYNTQELKHYRKKVLGSTFLYGFTVATPILVSVFYVYYPRYVHLVVFPSLVAVYITQWVVTLKIKGNAEKRLRKKIFTAEDF